MKYISQHDFFLQTNGKKIDVDGKYGNQCVDLWNYFNKIVNDGVYISCGVQGYAYGIFENRNTNGALKYFDVIDTSKTFLQDGDWVFWGWKSKPCPSSHVAMFRKDNGNGTGIFLGQNQGGKLDATDQRTFSYSGIIGALRPKIYPTASQGGNSTSGVEYLNLSPSVSPRTVYNLSIDKKVGSIKPATFGGLSYKIQKRLNDRYVQISTGSFGQVAICIDPKVATGFNISNTCQYDKGD